MIKFDVYFRNVEVINYFQSEIARRLRAKIVLFRIHA